MRWYDEGPLTDYQVHHTIQEVEMPDIELQEVRRLASNTFPNNRFLQAKVNEVVDIIQYQSLEQHTGNHVMAAIVKMLVEYHYRRHDSSELSSRLDELCISLIRDLKDYNE